MSNSSQSQITNENKNSIKSGDNSEKISSDSSQVSTIQNTLNNAKFFESLLSRLEQENNQNKLKLDLKPIKDFVNENKQIFKLYENEDNIIDKIKTDGDKLHFDDIMFEEIAVKILSDAYSLKEYSLYPYFKSVLSKNGRKVTKICYNKIDLEICDNNGSKTVDKKKEKKIPIINLYRKKKITQGMIINKNLQHYIS